MMRWLMVGRLAMLPLLVSFYLASPVWAAPSSCKNTGSYSRWLEGFKKEAAANGVSRSTIRAALSDVPFDPRIIKLDRRQSFFSQNFLQFSSRLVSNYRLKRGPQLIKKYRKTFARIDKQFGVPAPVIVGLWALESDFGANMGKDRSLRSLATLAYDCRRPELFRPELMAALKIIDRGDLRPSEMIGSWAGELGQTQFLPSHYFNHGVDYDGDGRRNLIKSTPDLLASTANFLRHLGWKRGKPWLQEVRVPRRLDWKEADITIQHPRSTWRRWGVSYVNGKALPNDNLGASLLLPMGRSGPAFLAYDNFKIYLEWNNSLVYGTTAAYLATRIAGAPRVGRGRGEVAEFGYKKIRQLQSLLSRRGYDVGGVDGKMGVKTRAAVKAEQIKLGLPADSYPTPKLLSLLRGR